MTYRYTAKKNEELEQIAGIVLAQFPNRRNEFAVDIEGVLEDLGLDLLPRRGLKRYAEGYLARDPRIIVIDESILSFMPRARFTLAEEVCHLILEYELWSDGIIPEGAKSHELSEKQHFFVEKDAKTLASALLMPREDFKVVFHAKLREFIAADVPAKKTVAATLEYVSNEFEVSKEAAFYRARNLKLVDSKGQAT